MAATTTPLTIAQGGRLYGKLSSWDAYAPVSTAALVLTLASTVLAAFPSPLPGFSDDPAKVASLMRWALWMMNSPPRTRETDTELSVAAPSQFFFSETISQLERHIACASVDHLVGASQRTPIHGPAAGHPLHMIQDVNFKTLKATNVDASTDGGGSKQIADWRRLLLGRLLACLTRKATNLVLPITCPRASAPEGLTSAQTIPEEYEYLAVCAWLSIKEVGLLLGSLVNAVPVPSPNQKRGRWVMAEKGIKEAGDLCMHIMLSSRHRGALEKSVPSLVPPAHMATKSAGEWGILIETEVAKIKRMKMSVFRSVKLETSDLDLPDECVVGIGIPGLSIYDPVSHLLGKNCGAFPTGTCTRSASPVNSCTLTTTAETGAIKFLTLEGVEMASIMEDYMFWLREDSWDRSLLSFHKGEIVTIISRDASGWWKGKIEDKVGQFPKDNVEVLILKPGSTGKDYAESPRAPSLKQRLMNGGLASSDESEQSGGVAKPTEMKGVARMNSRAYYQQLNSSGGLADTDTRTVYAPSSNVKRYPLAEYATKHFNIEERTKEEKINPTPGMTAADVLTTYSDSPLKCPLHKGLDEASVKIVIDISQLQFRLLERKRAQEHQRTAASAVLFRNGKFGHEGKKAKKKRTLVPEFEVLGWRSSDGGPRMAVLKRERPAVER
ncbi:SH3 domain containing protein [Acanthamoeba castellanii str. Neff]|uniref:SH3 domain containing protein n=1 Tax=Acanthamoeba castellanii (strain ATCC 30010 / Neff) TaxID=1257118 RepID=L8HL34_ACACF|nr:SH3 domain containing protein [Acanthamoeba castellanii str. Neff]ELR25383.1 SH3 domain containing protein [Acanthamoeba castellanii str. Neff]